MRSFFLQSISLLRPRLGVRIVAYVQLFVQLALMLVPFRAISTPEYPSFESEQEVMQEARMLAQAQQSRSVSHYATQRATGLLTGQVTTWLQQFGTARIDLGVDTDFSPRIGEADILLPLYKNENSLFFTQNGFRSKHGQITGNFGLGQRYFVQDWMIGYNAFYDQNFSHSHKRVGVGLETWRNFLKFSGNGYFRLSDWRGSGDLEDYDARPSNGFDIRAEGWIPDYPSLGARLMYEKYYGDDVALFGKDKREKDPGAFTFGINYTPVSLISLAADHREGDSHSDTRFHLRLTYQLGVPFSKQVDVNEMAVRRSLSGSSMDLVERNNNIVLDYRKQPLITFTLPQNILGQSGDTLPIDYNLMAKYGLSKIVWNATELTSAGGKITDTGNGRYELTLPIYSEHGSNTYPLSGIAYDTKGNAAPVASTLVTVTNNAEVESISVDKKTATADGTDVVNYQVRITDALGHPMPNETVYWEANLGQLGENNSVTNAEGFATTTLTSTKSGTVKIKASLENGSEKEADPVEFEADPKSANIVEVTKDHVNAIANGIDTVTYTATVKDANDNPSANYTVNWSTDLGTLSMESSATDEKGVATVTLTSKEVGSAKVKAGLENGSEKEADPVEFKADDATTTVSVTSDRTTATADGKDKITYTAIIKDADGNPNMNQTVHWFTTLGTLSTESSITDKNGATTVTLTSDQEGSALVTASSENGSEGVADAVEFTPGLTITLSSDKEIITGSGLEKATLTATVTDAAGKPAQGIRVNWGKSIGNFTPNTGLTSANGQVTIDLQHLLPATQNSTINVTATIEGQSKKNTAQRDITVRAVIRGNLGSLFWTLFDHPTLDKTAAQNNCLNYGGGNLAGSTEITSDLEGKDFKNMEVPNEYKEVWYNVDDYWGEAYYSFHSGLAPLGTSTTTKQPNAGYVCSL